MKTFLDYYKTYQKDKSFRFSLYYIVKGKSPRVEESDGCAFRTDNDGWISICRPPQKGGGWMRRVMHNACPMYFGLFKKEEDLNTSILKDNWNHTAKTAYLNKEDAEKELIK
jgi:hypothetical protein